LLNPARDGRSRFYGPGEVALLTLILRGRRWGFALEEIRQWLLIYEEKGTNAQLQAWVELADRQLADLQKQKEQLETSIAELNEVRDSTQAALDKQS